MKNIIFILFIWATAALNIGLQAQILTVSPGTEMTIKAGTIFSADSLVLQPSADFTLSNNSLNKNTMVSHPIRNAYIARVYQFSNTTNRYIGVVQINYRDGAELKGIPENTLALNIFNGTYWKAYPSTTPPTFRNPVSNWVITSGVSGYRLNELTLGTDCPKPILHCNADTVVDAAPGRCGARVTYGLPVATDLCGIAQLIRAAGLPSGALFPVGTTTNTFIAVSNSGKKDTCSFTVTVLDKQPPFIVQVSVNPVTLWPADGTMQNVTINYNAGDNCGVVNTSLDVSSNEPVTGPGYGDTSPDWVIVDDHHVQLRSERGELSNGRIYTITVTSTDAAGNTTTVSRRVYVPSTAPLARGNESEGAAYTDQLFDCKVTPNPGSQYFNLQVTTASSEKIDVNLLDVSGQLLSKLAVVKNQVARFGDDLRPGMYMIEVRQGGQSKILKVIKQ
jgi:HYR domain/Secretion system C-terminal sorting domain